MALLHPNLLQRVRDLQLVAHGEDPLHYPVKAMMREPSIKVKKKKPTAAQAELPPAMTPSVSREEYREAIRAPNPPVEEEHVAAEPVHH